MDWYSSSSSQSGRMLSPPSKPRYERTFHRFLRHICILLFKTERPINRSTEPRRRFPLVVLEIVLAWGVSILMMMSRPRLRGIRFILSRFKGRKRAQRLQVATACRSYACKCDEDVSSTSVDIGRLIVDGLLRSTPA